MADELIAPLPDPDDTEQSDPLAKATAALAEISQPSETVPSASMDIATTVVDDPKEQSSDPIVSSDTSDVTDAPETASIQVSERQLSIAEQKLDDLMGRITSPFDKPGKLKWTIFGPPGVGKTVLACRSPKWLLVNVEKGHIVLRGHRDLVTKECQVLEFKSMYQLSLIIDLFEADHESMSQYETIIVDTLNRLQDKDLDEITILAAKENGSRQRGVIESTDGDYQKTTAHMNNLIDRLCNLDKHIIFTCHAKEEKDGENGVLVMRPDVTPQVAKHLFGSMDLVSYLTTSFNNENQVIRNLQVHPTKTVRAKTRINSLPMVITNPTFDPIYAALMDEGN